MLSQIQQPDLWVIIDNSPPSEYDWSIAKELPWVVYMRVTGDITIGEMRNRCMGVAVAAGAEHIIFWDDDDYYPPTRIYTGVKALMDNPEADIAASSRMFLFLVRENVMLETGPFGPKHGTAATYTIRRRYAETHKFPDKARGEELEFTDQWNANMIQVPSEETIVVMGHGRNTVDKSDILRNLNLYKAKIANDINGKMFFRARWPVPWDLFRSTFFDARCDRLPESTPMAPSRSADYLIRHTEGTVRSSEHHA